MRPRDALSAYTRWLLFVPLVAVVPCSSCSESKLGSWQENAAHDYKLFDLLDKYPALHDLLDKTTSDSTVAADKPVRPDQCNALQIRLDQCVVNALLADLIDQYYQENTKALAGQYVTIDSTLAGLPNQYPLQNTVQLLRHLLNRVIEQDNLDKGVYNPNTKQWSSGPSSNAKDLFAFLDDINAKSLNLGDDLLLTLHNVAAYRLANYDNALMRKEVEYANADLDATPCQDATYDKDQCAHVLAQHRLLPHLQSTLAKSMMLADYPMCLNSSDQLITDAAQMASCTKDLGLGNAVRGNQALLMAVFELIKDETFKNSLFDLIRRAGAMLSNTIPKTAGSSETIALADVVETLVRNLEKYFTTGGANATGKYSENSNEIYSSAELRNTLRELQTGLNRVMFRSDRDNSSLIYEVTGKKRYVLDEFLKHMKLLGWDPGNARIEESLEDLLRLDQYGRDRASDPKAYKASHLESLFFLSAVASKYGWTDAAKDGVDGEAGKNYGHGHGRAREGRAEKTFNPSPNQSSGSTVNDALYAMGTNMILGVSNQYEMTFFPTDQDHLFRSLFPFTIDGDPGHILPGKDENKFSYDQNYPIAFMITGAVGAPGSPTGGTAPKDSSGNFILNGYMPFNPVGDENDNIALSTALGLWHICWNGYGPYYYAPEKAGKTSETAQLYGKTWHKYNRANGKLYALVHKPEGARSDNWEYLYPPNDGQEPLYPMAFYVGRIDRPVTLPGPATAKITLDDRVYTVTFPAAQPWDRDALVTFLTGEIDWPFSVIAYGKNKFRISGTQHGDPKIVKIENVSGPNVVELLFNGNGNEIIRTPYRAEFFNQVNYSDYYLGYYEDSMAGSKYSTLRRNDAGDIELINLTNAPGQDQPSGVLTEELLADNDKSRACASPEEAFFRNYQWFFNERKHLLIMPLRMTLGEELESGIVYQYQESNGFFGFANARPFKANGVWAKADTAGNSTIPGDFRMGIAADFESISSLMMNADAVYNDTLGGGPGFSSVLAHNLASLARLGFPTITSGTLTWTDSKGNKRNETVVDGLVPSYAFDVGDATWNKRNAMVPILVGMFNALRENTDYKRSNTTGLVPFFDAMTLLLKPISYYQKDSGPAPHNSWKYRVVGDGNGEGDFIKSGGEFHMSGDSYVKPETWYGSNAERDYFQADAIPTVISTMIDSNRYPSKDSDKRLLDGLLPFLVRTSPGTQQRPQLLTQFFKMVMTLADDKFSDPAGVNNDLPSQEFDKTFESWGARRKIFYGLEQSAALSKGTMGTYTAINEKTKIEKLPAWMFTSGVDANGDGTPDDMRKEEVFANVSHNITIGSNDYSKDIKPGELGYEMGLACLPHEWDEDPQKLALFRKDLEMMAELLKPQGDYSVVETLIGIMDKFFSQVSPSNQQIKALIHTLGITSTSYNTKTNTWNLPSVPVKDGKIAFNPFDFNDPNQVAELYRIAAQFQPIINHTVLAVDKGLEISFDEGNGKTITINTSNYFYDTAKYMEGFSRPGGLASYAFEVLDSSDNFGPTYSPVDPTLIEKEGMIPELYRFLGEKQFTDFNSTLWKDLAKLLAGQVQVLTRNNTPSAGRDHMEDLGFQYNGANLR
jgi:hypothetical protein